MNEHQKNQRDALHTRVENDFTYHEPVSDEQRKAYELVRRTLGGAAHTLIDNVPMGRELSQALTDLDNACMHANAGIARNEATFETHPAEGSLPEGSPVPDVDDGEINTGIAASEFEDLKKDQPEPA